MRLIDADELIKRIPITHADDFQNCRNCSLLEDWEVEVLVDDAPTIDAVEVVRCKDCIHCFFCRDLLNKEPDDFCSDGIRRG